MVTHEKLLQSCVVLLILKDTVEGNKEANTAIVLSLSYIKITESMKNTDSVKSEQAVLSSKTIH